MTWTNAGEWGDISEEGEGTMALYVSKKVSPRGKWYGLEKGFSADPRFENRLNDWVERTVVDWTLYECDGPFLDTPAEQQRLVDVFKTKSQATAWVNRKAMEVSNAL